MKRSDQLEQFVKNQLADYEEAPCTSLWERIEGAIPMPERKQRKFWLLWALLAVLLVSGFVGWHFYSMAQWKARLAQQEGTIQTLWSEIEGLQEQLVQKQEINTSPVLAAEVPGVNPIGDKKQVIVEADAVIVSRDEAVGEENEERLLVSDLDPPADPIVSPGITPLPELRSQPSTNRPIIAHLPEKIPSIVSPLLEREKPTAFSALPILSRQNSRWSVGTWLEGTNFHDNPISALWNTRSRREIAVGNSPSFYINNPSSTKTFGLFVDYRLGKRWSLRSGLGYKEQRRPLGGDFVFAYTLDNSQMNALGHSVSPYSYYDESYNISISTVIANALSNGPDGLEPGELFEMDFDVYQQTLYVSVPLWLTYQMGGQRLSYHMRAGLVWNGLMEASSKVRYLSFSFSQLYYQGHAINDGSVQVGYLDAGLGYGIDYRLGRHFSLYADGVMYKSVTPIFDRQPFSMGFGAGLKYDF